MRPPATVEQARADPSPGASAGRRCRPRPWRRKADGPAASRTAGWVPRARSDSASSSAVVSAGLALRALLPPRGQPIQQTAQRRARVVETPADLLRGLGAPQAFGGPERRLAHRHPARSCDPFHHLQRSFSYVRTSSASAATRGRRPRARQLPIGVSRLERLSSARASASSSATRRPRFSTSSRGYT